MADDKGKAGKPDRDRVNVTEDHERRDWARKFGCSETDLRNAVKAVGPMAKDVEAHLKSK